MTAIEERINIKIAEARLRPSLPTPHSTPQATQLAT